MRSFTDTKIFDELKDLENEYRKFNVIKSKMKAVVSLNCENWGVVHHHHHHLLFSYQTHISYLVFEDF